ncbi:MAG: prepilin-type N-terminal cleavage/methylation domain-containing protein [Candidatus Pacebacteria bacterium]|nr:prepilin-type N-terminal cleavage/methylation domain-containing protein [Candidatus Paceibacterota bacterium]MDD5357095.1 prepilin-type N-terminal cleavage/methylation domain-containing protein [Candidatus Paceibacterota bacterium]
MSSRKKGFTLIELLVVITIIAILALIVIVSLSASRAKTADAGIQSELKEAQKQIELYYATNGNYGITYGPGFCGFGGTVFSNTKVRSILDNAGKLSGGSGVSQGKCVSRPNSWAISMPLKTSSAHSWCVDSNGVSRRVSPSVADQGFSSGVCKAGS